MALQGKQVFNYILVPAIVVLVGVAAFGLGRLSALKESQTPLVIYPAEESLQEHANRD